MGRLSRAWKRVKGTLKAIVKNPLTAIAAIGLAIFAPQLGLRLLTSLVVSSVLQKQQPDSPTDGAGSNANPGNRQQLPPATNNKLPVVYGTAWVSPVIVDAKISTDNQTMWYVMALSEAMDNDGIGTFSFGNIYWGDKLLTFDGTDRTKVVSWTNLAGQTSTKVNGNMNVYLYRDGSFVDTNTGGVSAVTVLQDASIPAGARWTSNNTMSKTVFAIVKVKYNQDAGLVGLDQLRVQLTNSLTKPGSVMLDYLKNSRYGANLYDSQLLSNSFVDLNTYSDIQIPYTDTSGNTQQQPRYRFNGVVDTSQTVLTNWQYMTDSCDSFIQYNEAAGQWAVVINKAYDQAPGGKTLQQLFSLDSTNIIGGITITPLDLNSTPNSAESSFPNSKMRDQLDYAYAETPLRLRNRNEPDNKLSIQYNFVNNSVGAQYLTNRKLEQVRADLIVDLTADYSAIQVDAGDVVKVSWDFGGSTFGYNIWDQKLFRVMQVQESKTDTGELTAKLQLTEYSAGVYDNFSIQDYTPPTISNVTDPNIVPAPATPVISNQDTTSTIPNFRVSATIPSTGSIAKIEFWYGTSSSVGSTWILHDTQTYGGGPLYPPGFVETITVSSLPQGTYYWAVSVVTIGGQRSDYSSAAQINWNPSPTATAIGQNFQTTFTPPVVLVPRYSNGVPNYANATTSLYGLAGAQQYNYIFSLDDNSNNFVANTWRIASNANSSALNSITTNGVIITIPTDGGNFAQFPQPNSVAFTNASVTVPVRFKDAANVVYQAPPSRFHYVFVDAGANGDPGYNGLTVSTPRIYFSTANTVTEANISITGGIFNRSTQSFQTLPTVFVDGSSVTPNAQPSSVQVGQLRWTSESSDVAANNTGTFNITYWTTPVVDGGYGPAGANGISPASVSFELNNGAFYRNNEGNITPSSITLVPNVINVPSPYSISYSITGGNGTQLPNNAYQFSATGTSDTVVVTMNAGGYFKSAIIPFVTSGNAGPAGNRGFIPIAYIPITTNPTTATTAQFSAAWQSSTGLTPINSDAGVFYFTANNQVTSGRVYNSTTSTWNAASLVVPGDVLVAGSVRAVSLAANDIYARNFASTNAVDTFGQINSPGFWIRASDGDASFAGNVHIGQNLTVDGLIQSSQLAENTVGTNNVGIREISAAQWANSGGVRQVNYTNNTSWPNNTRGTIAYDTEAYGGQTIIPQGNPAQGARIVVGFSVGVSSTSDAASQLVELWVNRASVGYTQTVRAFSPGANLVSQNYAAGSGGVFLRGPSSAGAGSWVQQTTNTTLDTVTGIASRNGLLSDTTAVTEFGDWCTVNGTNGIQPSKLTDDQYYGLVVVNEGAGTYYAAGAGGEIGRLDGGAASVNNPTVENTGVLDTLRGIAVDNRSPGASTFNLCAVGDNGRIVTSNRSPGTSPGTWVSRTSGTTNTLFGVGFGNGIFVAVGAGGVVCRSSTNTGASWTASTIPGAGTLRGVAWARGYWVAAGFGGEIYYSTDAITWTAATITGASAGRDLYCVDVIRTSDGSSRFHIGGQAGIWRSGSSGAPSTFDNVWDGGTSPGTSLTRLWYQGSNQNVFNNTPGPTQQQLVSGSTVSGIVVDDGYTPLQSTTYYLVVGNMAQTSPSTTYYSNPLISVSEYKR